MRTLCVRVIEEKSHGRLQCGNNLFMNLHRALLHGVWFTAVFFVWPLIDIRIFHYPMRGYFRTCDIAYARDSAFGCTCGRKLFVLSESPPVCLNPGCCIEFAAMPARIQADGERHTTKAKSIRPAH